MNDSRDSNRDGRNYWSDISDAIRWRVLLRDVAFVTVWVAVLSFGWGFLRWPTWGYYVVVFGGIVAYSSTFDPWTESTTETG